MGKGISRCKHINFRIAFWYLPLYTSVIDIAVMQLVLLVASETKWPELEAI